MPVIGESDFAFEIFRQPSASGKRDASKYRRAYAECLAGLSSRRENGEGRESARRPSASGWLRAEKAQHGLLGERGARNWDEEMENVQQAGKLCCSLREYSGRCGGSSLQFGN